MVLRNNHYSSNLCLHFNKVQLMPFIRLSHILAQRAAKDVWIIGSVWYQSLEVEMVESSFSGKDQVRTEELLEWGEAFNIMNQIGVVFVLFQFSAAEKLKLQNVVRPLLSTVQWTILSRLCGLLEGRPRGLSTHISTSQSLGTVWIISCFPSGFLWRIVP